MAGAIASGFFFLIIFLQSNEDATGDVTFCDHPNQFMIFVNDRQASKLFLCKCAERADDGVITCYRYNLSGHILASERREVILLKRSYNIFQAQDADEPVVFQDWEARDAVDA